MARAESTDPWQDFRFRVHLLDEDGEDVVAGFTTVTIPSASVNTREIESGIMIRNIQVPEGIEVGNASFEHGIFNRDSFFLDWAKAAGSGNLTRRNTLRESILVSHFRRDDVEQRYVLHGCFPIDVQLTGDLDANSSEVSVRTIEFNVHRIETRKGVSESESEFASLTQ